jgi:hypothetical protein
VFDSFHAKVFDREPNPPWTLLNRGGTAIHSLEDWR